MQSPPPTPGRTDWANLGPDNTALSYMYRSRLFGYAGVELGLLPIVFGVHSDTDLVIVLIVVVLVVGVIWLVHNKARRKAVAQLHAQPDLPLAKRVLISGFARRCPESFDVDLWIKETGPLGPRMILGNIKRSIPFQDETVYEDVDIDAELASANMRCWYVILLLSILIALGAWSLWRIEVKNTWTFAAVLLFFAGVLGYFLHYCRLNPVLRPVSIASIGTLEVTWLGRTTTYARDDSVLLINDVLMTERIDVSVLRRDGRHARFWFPNPRDPTLGKLIARWTHPAGQTT